MERTHTSQILLIFFRILFTLLVLWTLWFIFHNALEPGALSSAHSQAVTDALNRALAKVGGHPLTNAAVRKLAHFGEYCLLGFGYTLCLRVYTRHYIRHISWPLLLGLLAANADENLAVAPGQRSRRQPERCVAGFFGLLLRRPLCHLPPAHRQPSGHGAAAEEAMSKPRSTAVLPIFFNCCVHKGFTNPLESVQEVPRET